MYCYKCGNQMPDDYTFCPKCGAKVATAEEHVPDSKTHKLTIDRASQVYLVNPPIKVSIDNSILLSVDNGKNVQVDLPEGHHVIEFSASMRKTTLEIDMQKDTSVEVSFSRLSGKIVAKEI
ncbi:MAG: zinc ribbon domain-containing protein [Oscillospiraceae bacterium]|nr:zinc ribbon domain-containing protein [Oscillospiraceae bacterium]